MKTHKKLIILTILAALASPLAVCAESGQKREFADIYTDCGLGAMIAPSNNAVAAVTNVTWDLGTTAISSNISSPSTCVGGKQKMASFIHESQDMLFSDLANGTGKYLDALVAIAGVEKTKKDKFISSIRLDTGVFVQSKNFEKSTRFDRAERLYNIINDNISS